MLLAREGRAAVRIHVGPQPSRLQCHAAEELASYLKQVTGSPFRISRRGAGGEAAIAVGRADTNPLISRARDAGMISPGPESTGGDGFVVRTIRLDGRDVLVIGGSNDRGTLYAVYCFLEEVLGLGFFRDGEQVPRSPTLRVGSVDIVEKPRFPNRQDGSGCIFAYSTPYWTWEDWRKELDWRAKRRANMIWPFNVGGEILDLVMADWGVAPASPRRQDRTIHHKALEYARELGMRVPVILPSGHLPDAFFRAHPECRTLLTQYSEFAPTRQLHPSDPFFGRLIVDYVRHYSELYGTDHIYIAEFVSESRILDRATDVQAARVEFARATSKAIRRADPDGIWAPSSWSFDTYHDPPEGWTRDQIREYLDAIEVPVVVWDIWAEEAAKYELTDFFFGRPWGFGVLHSFGGDSYLHGDVAGLIDRVQSMVKDPRANTCNLFLSTPEIIDFNGFYLELTAKLSWDPARISLQNHLRHYCEHRYGRECGRAMEPAWRDLVQTVYGPDSGSIAVLMNPLYWLRPNLALVHGSPSLRDRVSALWQRRERFIPVLRHALEVFLEQIDLLNGSPLARRDMVDVARQWIAELFNREIRAARDAFLAGQSEAFEHHASQCLGLLDQQTRLLSSWTPYRLDRKVERARSVHGEEAEHAVKHFHLWVTYKEGPEWESEPLLDYHRMDLDELVRGYYRPRVEAFLEHLRKRMGTARDVNQEELESEYMRIARKFVSTPSEPLPEGGDPVDLVRELLGAAGVPVDP